MQRVRRLADSHSFSGQILRKLRNVLQRRHHRTPLGLFKALPFEVRQMIYAEVFLDVRMLHIESKGRTRRLDIGAKGRTALLVVSKAISEEALTALYTVDLEECCLRTFPALYTGHWQSYRRRLPTINYLELRNSRVGIAVPAQRCLLQHVKRLELADHGLPFHKSSTKREKLVAGDMAYASIRALASHFRSLQHISIFTHRLFTGYIGCSEDLQPLEKRKVWSTLADLAGIKSLRTICLVTNPVRLDVKNHELVYDSTYTACHSDYHQSDQWMRTETRKNVKAAIAMMRSTMQQVGYRVEEDVTITSPHYLLLPTFPVRNPYHYQNELWRALVYYMES